MELILKEDVQNLGFKDDVVNVKNGYGRNFLIPQGLAAMATISAKKVLAENLKQRAHKVTNGDLAETLAKEGHAIDKKFISILGGAVKRTGPYNAQIRLHREVIVDFGFEVIAEQK